MDTATRNTLTTGEIARLAGGERWHLLAALRRGFLAEPAGRCGVMRVWTEADLPRVRAALASAGYVAADPTPTEDKADE